MDALLVLVVCVALGVPVLLVVLVVVAVRHGRRIRYLEQQIDRYSYQIGLLSAAAASADRAEMPATQRPLTEAAPPPAGEVPAQGAAAASPEAASGPWSAPPSAASAAPPEVGPTLSPLHRHARQGPSAAARLASWVRVNWVYAVSALSLALAGVFLVQYGIEKGLLTPAMRVWLAILLGAALIAAGEWVRRRFGDSEASASAYVPSTFSGAGIVVTFSGILAARQLYG